MKRKVRSLAPVRKGAVNAKSFGKSSARLHYLFNKNAENLSKAEKIALWNRFIPLTPATAARILSRDLPDDTIIELSLQEDGRGDIDITAFNKFEDSGSFDLKDKTLDAGLVTVDENFQGKGIGRILFRNQIEFFYACGVRKFDLCAGLDNGGYSWARVGFLPDTGAENRMKAYVANPALDTVKMLDAFLTAAEKTRLKKYLQFENRQDLWRIADAPIDLGPRLKSTFNKAAGEGVSKREQRKASKKIESLRDHFSEGLFSYMAQRAEKGQPVMIGRLLLTGTYWNGLINMNNVRQMERLGNYAGGWKYLEIK